MAVINSDDLISVSDAAKRGLSSLLRDVESGREPVLMRNNQPVAVIVGMHTLERMQHVEDDLADLALTLAQVLADTGKRTDLDEVLRRLGYTREQLTDIVD